MMFNRSVNFPRKILILTAIPQGLRLDVEVREIEESIRRSVQRDRYTITVRTAIRPKDFMRVLAEEKPNIVHFCGHGHPNGCLQLEDDSGRPKLVTPQALAALFELHSQYVYCLLLNACHSEKAAIAISQHISYAIGINQSVQSGDTAIFARGFYDAIGQEAPDASQLIEQAFKVGKVALQMEGSSQHAVPILKRRFHYPPQLNPGFKPPVFPQPNPRESDAPFPFAREEVPSKPSSFEKQLYADLRQHLQNGDWRAADVETHRIMLAIAQKENKGWLTSIDIQQKIACTDLKIIDTLWYNLSGGKFGLSVQKDIWIGKVSSFNDFDESLFGTFGRYVGWRTDSQWLSYDNLDFTDNSPVGHLPVMRGTEDDQQSNWFGAWRDNIHEFICLSQKCL